MPTKKEMRDTLYNEFGLTVTQRKLERYLQMRTGSFPVDKLNVIEIPGATRRKYSVFSVADYLYACQRPAGR